MIALALSIALGLGVLLVYEGLTNPGEPDPDGRRLDRVRDFLIRAGLREVTPRDFVLFSLGSGLVVTVLAQLVLGWPILSLLGFGLGLGAPFAYFVQRHDRRRRAIQGALAEAIAQLRDGIRTGLSIQEALAGLARHGPDALRPEFALLTREIRLAGFEPALLAMRDRLADPLFDVVTAALLLNDRLGGRNVSQILDSLAAATRAELRVQRELRAYQARNVLSARIVAAVPVVVLVGVRAISPRYLAVFDDWSGQVILALCAVSVVVGYLAMLWISRLPDEPRVLP